MPTNTQGRPARELPFQAVHYMRKTVNFNDTGITTGIAFKNWLPSGARIVTTWVNIDVVFNAATTNVLTVGQNSSSYNDIVASGDVDETALGTTAVVKGGALGALAADTQVFIKYTQTGTPATTGKATVVLQYVPGNDE